jgi:hypothetical protein
MKNSVKFTLSYLALASLVACGGGGGSAPAATATAPAPAPSAAPAPAPAATPAPAPVASGPVPSPTSTPTAALQNSQAGAETAVTEVNAGYASAQNGATGAGFKGPLGVESGALPTGISASIPCSSFGGTGSIEYDIGNFTGGITAGTTLVYTYKNCSFSGYTYNGTFKIVYDTFVSDRDFSYTASYQNFTITGNGLSNYAFSGSQSCRYANSSISCYYSDGSRGWSSNFTYSGGSANGSYSANYSGGSVSVTYTNYSATSGTARVTGANGAYYEVRRCSATAYTVTYSGGGATGTYKVGGGCS